jgi:CDP-glucose 4,6-dehydratase
VVRRASRLEGLVAVRDVFWSDRSVLVTGATGLLGGWLSRMLLERGARVIALVRDQVPDSYFAYEGLADRSVVVRGELADLPLIERTLLEYEVTAVFHLGAQSQVGVARRGPYHTLEANVRGTYTVLEAVRRTANVEALVVASSDKAYGEQPALPYTEDMSLLAENPYDASKAAADLLARAYARSYGLPIVVTRCGNLFGGGDLNWSRLVPGTVRSLLREERPVIRSDGTPVRDYLYAFDAAAGCLDAASRARELAGEALNFSLERPLTVLELVDLVIETVGVRLAPDVRNDAVGEIPRQYLSAEKARLLLRWRPQVRLEDGIRETVAWYRDYLRRD